MRIPLTQYGWREVLTVTVVCAGVAAASLWTVPAFAAVPAAAWAYVLWFFRDPPRRPDDAGAFLAPADGRVVDITPVGPDGPLGVEGVRIGVFMSIFDVHVNRSPCAATVRSVRHHAGGFVDARLPEAAEANESATVLLTHSRWGRSFPLAVRQVAGLIARRIVTDLRPGQELAAGQRIGMIKFGSRVDVFLPGSLVGEVCVQVGRTVRGGQTVLARPPEGGPA